MIVVRWILFSLFMFCFGCIALANLIGPIRATRQHGYSMAPLIGGGFCALGLVIIPVWISGWWWLLPLLDLGTTMPVWAVPGLIWITIRGPGKRV